MLYRVHLAMSGIQTHNTTLVLIYTDCIGKSNYQTTTTTTPRVLCANLEKQRKKLFNLTNYTHLPLY